MGSQRKCAAQSGVLCVVERKASQAFLPLGRCGGVRDDCVGQFDRKGRTHRAKFRLQAEGLLDALDDWLVEIRQKKKDDDLMDDLRLKILSSDAV